MSIRFNAFAAMSAAAVAFALAPVAVPQAHAEVMVSALSGSLCMDLNTSTNKVALWTCHGGGNQNFFTGAYGQVRYNGQCLDAGGDGSDMFMAACDGNKSSQRWGLDNASGSFRNEGGWCADIPFQLAYQGQRIQMHKCNGGRNQMWGRGGFSGGANSGVLAGAQAGAVFYGGAKIGQSGTPIVAQGGGNIVAQGGGNIVAQGGGNIVSITAGKIVAQGGGN